MWTYVQLTGHILNNKDELVAIGYSGKGEGKNNPTLQNVAFTGPIPVGLYRIGEPYNSLDHGPYVLPLTPDPANDMFHRDAFLIHGERLHFPPGGASEGCIILPRTIRELIHNSMDHDLKVVDVLPPAQVTT